MQKTYSANDLPIQFLGRRLPWLLYLNDGCISSAPTESTTTTMLGHVVSHGGGPPGLVRLRSVWSADVHGVNHAADQRQGVDLIVVGSGGKPG